MCNFLFVLRSIYYSQIHFNILNVDVQYYRKSMLYRFSRHTDMPYKTQKVFILHLKHERPRLVSR